ncbi:hypothetical protein QBC46DRAFT_348241 [Diplogelasinospora grovesii]|uniref:Uncharacterized protein n=1 Tax=Diplogelasinospora grovesii TaxID=303347 RepID=A0AAN6MVV8_9PEZI|nr:hypothetical protein QBC46DRAFT_348241 [Diplogelasinospora grovesii]
MPSSSNDIPDAASTSALSSQTTESPEDDDIEVPEGLGLYGNCHNVLSHRTAQGGTRYPIDADEFARLNRVDY